MTHILTWAKGRRAEHKGRRAARAALLAALVLLLLALTPAVLLAVESDGLLNWIIGAPQTSSGGGYTLTDLDGPVAQVSSGGDYTLNGRVGGLMVAATPAPRTGPSIWLPIVTNP